MATPTRSMLPATVGMPPTVSCAPLLMTIWTIFLGALAPSTAMAPMCISTAPSPSMHQIFCSGLFIATPSAMDEACPIEPTVRKSYLWLCPFATLVSKSSLLAFPVVETIGSSPVALTMCRMISSLTILLSFLYSTFTSAERAPFLITNATSLPLANKVLNTSMAFSTSSSVVSLPMTKLLISMSSRSLIVTSP